jgi:hypothetical protein
MNIRRFVSVLLAGVIMLATIPPLAATAAPVARIGMGAPVAQETPTLEAQGDAVKTALDRMDSLLLDLDNQVDRTQFDLDELSFSLGVDPQEIVDFVRDNIAFEQYAGMLRGAQGTLMSRAGNALDEAALLQTLLVDAGYDTRIGHGTLSPQQAARLVQGMTLPRKTLAPPVQDQAAAQAILGQMLAMGGAGVTETASVSATRPLTIPQPVAVDESLQYRQMLAMTHLLTATLAAAETPLGDADAGAKVRDEAEDYFWVEYRLGPSDAWTQAHPAFKRGDAPTDLQATEYFDADQLPASLNQRVQLQVSIERSTGAQTETVPIMAPWVSNAADLVGAPHNFALMADGITDTTSIGNLANAFTNTRYYFPLLDGKLPEGALFFDPTGKTVSPAYATSPFAQIGGTISSTLAGAINAFGTETTTVTATQPSQLEAVWMDYTFLMPDGSHKTQRRAIWQRGESDGDAVEMGRQLTASYDFMVAAGTYPAAYILDRTINQLLDLRPLLNVAIQQEISPTVKANVLASLPAFKSGWQGHLAIFQLFNQLPRNQGTVSYLSEPMVVQHRQVVGERTVQAAIDIVNNTRRAYRSAGDELVTDAQQVLADGVWETVTEGATLPKDVLDRRNPQTVFAAVIKQRVPMRVLTATDTATNTAIIADLPWDSATKAAVERDLAAGYLVIAPEYAPRGLDYIAWWRINPATGETLGMDVEGGDALVEYIMLLQGVAGQLLCMGIASNDSGGLTPRDILVCTGVALGGTLGGGAAGLTLLEAAEGAATAAATRNFVIAVVASLAASAFTGVGRNDSPWLDK